MGWFGKLLGTDGAVKEVISSAKELVDDAWYTEDEKAEDRAAARREAQGMVVEWMRNTQGQNLSRRIIALSITSTWLAMFLISTCMDLAAVWASDLVRMNLAAAARVLDTRLDVMTGAVMLILGFYFAAPYMGDLARGAIERFGGKQKP